MKIAGEDIDVLAMLCDLSEVVEDHNLSSNRSMKIIFERGKIKQISPGFVEKQNLNACLDVTTVPVNLVKTYQTLCLTTLIINYSSMIH